MGPEVVVCVAPEQTLECSVCPPVSVAPGEKAKVEKAASDSSGSAPTTGDDMSLDALSALGDTLAAAEPKQQPPKLKPEDIVSEKTHEKEKGVRVGEREDTLPPEYRFTKEELKDQPAPKPEPTMDTGEALDFLSAGFEMSSAPCAPKPEPVVCPPMVVQPDLGQPVVCYGPEPTPKCPERHLVVCPPGEKPKEKIDDDLSLQSATTTTQPLRGQRIVCYRSEPTPKCPERHLVCPPGEKPKEKIDDIDLSLQSATTTTQKPEPVVCSSMVVDPVICQPVVCYRADPTPMCPEEPPLILRSPGEKPKKIDDVDLSLQSATTTVQKPEPVVCSSMVVDPVICQPVVCYRADPTPMCPEEPPLVLRSPGEKPKKIDDVDLSLQSATTTVQKPEPVVCSSMVVDPVICQPVVCYRADPTPMCPEEPPLILRSPGEKPKEKIDDVDLSLQSATTTVQGESMSADALSALGDTLGAPERKPELPELKPKDIVSEEKCKEEEGVLVGEREDTIPPDYRFSEDKLKDLPALKPEPTMDTSEALDILSEGFGSPSVPAVAPCVGKPSAPSAPTMDFSISPKVAAGSAPAKSEKPPAMDFSITPTVCTGPPADVTAITITAPAKPSADVAIDTLAGDLVMSAVAPAVKSAAYTSSETPLQLAAGADSALDVLSDALMDTTPIPKPPQISEKDIVKEKEAVEEKIVKMGERDDTLPPEFRPTEEDLKKMAEAKAKAAAAPKENPMGDAAALDLLSSDFAAAPAPTAPTAPCATATTQVVHPVLDTEAAKPMARSVLDSLANTLPPGPIEGKSKEEKSKKHHAEESPAKEQPSAPLKSDVVSASKKGAKH
ncbi:calpastatin isoform X2 [Thalassophryne amazonica]|uniref:calpastatin isoform X2 n=1 Tax=Thalassophryne amazonica TaxID=390379 RepID=UPI00147119BC|nr:calpastatin isoform X2 [Thalassophryne amazonica]